MSTECSNKDWIIELGVLPHEMSPVDPPFNDNDECYSRLLTSIYAMTLGETFSSHEIDPYILEHIQIEKECSEQHDLSSLAHHGEYSQGHLLQRYFQWWMNGYMCPTGLCFTPQVHLKKSIDLFGETQAAQAMGIEIDLSKKSSNLSVTPSSLLRLSPIGYFYAKHSYSKRMEILTDCAERMFGKQKSLDTFINYIELLVNALNGLSKQNILQSIKLEKDSNNLINTTFFDLIDLLSNDNDNIEQGVQYALSKRQYGKKECKYLNPYNSDETILLTLYIQISAAIYNDIPPDWLKQIHAKKTIESLTKWIVFQRNANLHRV